MSHRLVCSAAVLVWFIASSASAAVFVVTNSDTTGPGTLDQAIRDANANPGRDEIRFETALANAFNLPEIRGPVDIDGSIGISRATVRGPGSTASGLKFEIGSSGSTLRDLEMTNYFGAAVVIRAGVSEVTVTRTLLGLIQVIGSNNLIGTTTAGNRFEFVTLSGSNNELLRNGILFLLVSGSDNRVGRIGHGNDIATADIIAPGTTIVEDNTFSRRGRAFSVAIDVQMSNAATPPVISGNLIEDYPLGIRARSAAFVRENTIRNNTTGIAVVMRSQVEITGNSIYGGGIGIDLGDDGPTPNDPAPDADTGANNFQNYPMLTSAALYPSSLVVEGTLTSAPSTPYLIELFSNPAADPEARTLLASFQVTTDVMGTATFSRTVTSPLPVAGEVITSTATNHGTVATPGNAPHDTSEISAPVTVTQPGVLGFAATSISVDEQAGSVTLEVTRTAGSEGTVTVQYATANGTAIAPGDYGAASGTLTFAPGVTTQSIVIPIVGDVVPEPSETFTVTLSGAGGGAVLGAATATVTITEIAVAPIPTLSTWSMLLLILGIAFVVLLRR